MKAKLLLIAVLIISNAHAQKILIPNGGFNTNTLGWTIEGLNTNITSSEGIMDIGVSDIYASQFILKSPQIYLEANKIYKLFTDYSNTQYDPVNDNYQPLSEFSDVDLKNTVGISSANVNFVSSVGGGALGIYNSANFSVLVSGNYYLEYKGLIAPEMLFKVDNVAIEGLISYKFTGKVTLDVNNNSCASAGLALKNYSIQVNEPTSNISYNSLTDANGNYSIFSTATSTGNHITQIDQPFYDATPTSYTNIVNTGIVNFPNQNFCVTSNASVNDVSISIIPNTEARPGFSTSYRLLIKNTGTNTLGGSVNLNYDNTRVSVLTSVPVENAATASSLTWNYTNLLPLETRYINVTFTVFTPPTVNNGDNLNFTATVSPFAGDYTPQNNASILNQITVGSYDPNDITFLEGPYLTSSQATEYLNVLIRFQNTGTASAININVKNTLDALLDWNTFQTVASSHSYNTIVRNGNEVTFVFNGINLPDSTTNEPGSNGWVLYKIKPKSTFIVGNVISNVAQIYFDYNLPIITNTATTQINNVLSTSDNYHKSTVTIYPNPAENIVTLTINSSASFTLHNLEGQLMLKGKLINGKNHLNISALSSGIYFIKTTASDGKTDINKIYKN